MKDVYGLDELRDWSSATGGEKPPLRLAVFGDPVEHSASPPMHNAALEHCGIDARYCRLHIRPEELAEALRLLPKNDFIGTNLTIPHKAAAMAVMDEIDPQARRIGVINTVVVEDGRLIGFNTDGPGLLHAVRAEFSVDLRDLRVMVLGAGGGAGRAIATQCALEKCERLVLVNRSVEKAEALAEELRPLLSSARLLGPVERLEVVAQDDTDALRAQLPDIDLVINATSLGLKRTDPSPLPASALLPHLMIYDTIYSGRRTRLLSDAEEAGARGANGLSMLLHQGALSFEIWFNREAPLDVMRTALLDHMGQ